MRRCNNLLGFTEVLSHDEVKENSVVWFMGGDFAKTFHHLLTAIMLVVVLIACEKIPETQTTEEQPAPNLIDSF